jgi:hypothetical protein
VRAALLLALTALLAACAPGATATPGSAGSPGQAWQLTSPVDGVPIHIDAEGFTKVTAFTLRLDDGSQVRFAMGDLENGDRFPPNHLAEHLAGSTPVRVFFRDENGTLTAYRIEDVLTQ